MHPQHTKLAAAATIAILIAALVAVSWSQTDAQTSYGTPAASPAASPAGSPAASPVAAAPTIALKDIKFDPRQLTIAANTDVTISLPNQGAAVHNFNIDALNIHSGDIAPGATGSVTINAKPGDYTFYCNIPGHKDAGMVGVLHVQ